MRGWFGVFIGAASIGLIGTAIAIVVATHGFKFAPIFFMVAGLVGLVLAVIFYRKDTNDIESDWD